MNIAAKTDFIERSRQVSSYLLWLSRQEKISGLPDGVLNTAKASALLLIYNLMESASTNAIQNVFDSLSDRRIGFDKLTDEVKIVALSNLKRRSVAKMVRGISLIDIDIHRVSFDREDVFSGNVDAKLLRETMKQFGVDQMHDYQEPELLTIKNRRNDLAHGALSFADAGKDLSARELISKYWRVRVFFNNMLTDYSEFINLEKFLKVP